MPSSSSINVSLMPAKEDESLLSKRVLPTDKYHVAYCIFIIQGLGILLPWNAFISAAGYFTMLYGDSFMFFIALAFNWSGALAFIALMKILPRFSFISRVMVSLLTFFVVLIIIPFSSDAPNRISLPITLLGVFLTGLASTIMQSTIAGMAALFPPEYIGGMMSGCGVAGIVAISLRAITKVALPPTETGNETSGKLFFILSAFIMVICAISFVILLRLPITKHNLINYTKMKNLELHAAITPSVSQIIHKIWKEALSIVMTFFITLSLFPGITSLVRSDNDQISTDWFSIIFTAIFMIGDFVGRTSPRWVLIFTPQFLPIFGIFRLVFFPLLIFCIHPRIIYSDWGACIIVGMFSLSNGYISTLGMIYGPQKVASHEKELTGIILAGCITVGIILGAHFALLMLYIVNGNIGVKF